MFDVRVVGIILVAITIGVGIKHIQTIEPIIGGNIEDATKVAREILLRKLSARETQELLKPRREAIEKARVKAAEAAIGVPTPTSKKLEAPEDYEKLARYLTPGLAKELESHVNP